MELFPFTVSDGILTGLVFIGSIASVIGGVGGGGLYVPLLLLILSIEPHQAVPISKIAILSATLVAMTDVIRKGNIDYGICLQLQPMIMIGTLIGVILNISLPSTIVSIALILTLIVITVKTLQKAISMHRIEKYEKFEDESDTDLEKNKIELEQITFIKDLTITSDDDLSNSNSESNLDSNNESEDMVEIDLKSTDSNSSNCSGSLGNRYPDKRTVLPIMVFVWLSYLGFSIWRELNEQCSVQFWIALISPVIISLIVAIVSWIVLLRNNVIYTFGGLMAGVLSGCLGIGGGMVIGPMLLYMKIDDPLVTTSISTVLVLVTSSSTTLQFILFNTLEYDYGLWLAGWTALGAVIARYILRPLIVKFDRVSYILFVLTGVIFISCILTIVDLVVKLVDNDIDWEFRPMC